MFTSDKREIYKKLIELYDTGKPGVLVTVIDKKGFGPAPMGAKMLVWDNGSIAGTVGGGSLEYTAIEKASDVMETEQSVTEEYDLSEKGDVAPDGKELGMVCGGSAKLFYEYIPPKRRVFVIGAGHVGRALIDVLITLPYYIISIDERPGFQYEKAHRHIEGGVKNIDNVPDGSIFVVAGHSHDIDFEVLEWLVRHVKAGDISPMYVGVIASKSKAKTFRNRLIAKYGDIKDLPLYTPIGLDIGGKTPPEIAISIAAEIQAVVNRKEGNKHMNKGAVK